MICCRSASRRRRKEIVPRARNSFSTLKTGGARRFSGRRQPSCGDTSRMNREVQVRICEGLRVKFPGPTRHSLQIVARRKSVYVRNAPKADAKSKPWRLSRRVTAVIAEPLQCPRSIARAALAFGARLALAMPSRHVGAQATSFYAMLVRRCRTGRLKLVARDGNRNVATANQC